VNIHDYPGSGQGIDLSDTVTHVCVCGGTLFKIYASFDDYEIAAYSTEGECVECNTRVRVPTPIDKPGYYRE
jgi:hypothetical protein